MKRTDLARYLDLVRRRWQMLVLIVAVVVGASLLQSLTSTKRYETSSRVIIVEQNAADVVVQRPSRDLDRALPTERRALESQELLALVNAQLRREVDVRFSSQTPDLLLITARDSDPAEAAVAANIFASTFVEFRKAEAVERIETTRRQLLAESESLESRITTLEQSIDANPDDPSAAVSLANRRVQRDEFLSQIDSLDFLIASESGGLELGEPATIPARPVSPRPLRGAAFALVLGSILALAIALALEAIDDTVRSGRRLAGLTKGAPVLGVIPPYGGATPTIATLDRPDDPATEAYSSLRTAFLAVLRDQTRPIVQVTSAGANEGKSVVATNLAVTLSQIGLRVALVDADLRNPSLRRFFPQLPETGLAEILEGSLPIDTQLSDVGETTVLHALPAGLPDASPAELLSSPTAKQVFGRIAVEHDVTIVDTSSVIGYADANVIAALADFTLMVVRAGETKSEQVRRAFDALALIDARPLGVVLTDSRDSAAGAQDSFAPARHIRRRGDSDESELVPTSESGGSDNSNVRQIRQSAASGRLIGGRPRQSNGDADGAVAYRSDEAPEATIATLSAADVIPVQPDDPLPTPIAVHDEESATASSALPVDLGVTNRLGTAAAIAAVQQTTRADEDGHTAAKPSPVPPAPPPESAIEDAAGADSAPLAAAGASQVSPETLTPPATPSPSTITTEAKTGAPKPTSRPRRAATPGAKATPAKASPSSKAHPAAKAAPAKAPKSSTKRPQSKSQPNKSQSSQSKASPSAKSSAASAKTPSTSTSQAPVPPPPPPPASMTDSSSSKAGDNKASRDKASRDKAGNNKAGKDTAGELSAQGREAKEVINLTDSDKRRSKGRDKGPGSPKKSASPAAPKQQK